MLCRSKVLNQATVYVAMKRGVRKREEATIELLDVRLSVVVGLMRADAEEQAGTNGTDPKGQLARKEWWGSSASPSVTPNIVSLWDPKSGPSNDYEGGGGGTVADRTFCCFHLELTELICSLSEEIDTDRDDSEQTR